MLTRTRSSAEPLVRSSAGIKRIRREITTIPRTPTPPQQQSTTAAFNFSILSANVAGLRGVLKSSVKSENLKQSLLQAKPDILCLQEHKLQEQHIEDVQLQLKELLLPEFTIHAAFWSCSQKPGKLGYSGVSTLLLSATQPVIRHWSGFDVDDKAATKTLDDASSIHNLVISEGRIITVELPNMYIINTYVPNSGQGLKRTDYRTSIWDPMLGAYMRRLNDTKPVVIIGDLNVAFGVLDIHNFYPRQGFPNALGNNEYKGLSQLKKQAGCTQIERDSFQTSMLGKDNDFVDSFRHFWPQAEGCFTYWSQRAGNRQVNRGLRLDYAVCSANLLDNGTLVDSFLLDDSPPFSDHAAMGVRFNLEL